MAWVDMPTRSTGYTVTATNWNNMVGNFDMHQTWTLTWNPTLEATSSNPNIGTTGFTKEQYWMVGSSSAGGMVSCQCKFEFGGTGIADGSGFYRVAPPVTADQTDMDAMVPVGGGYAYIDASAAFIPLIVVLATASYFQFVNINTGARFDDGDVTWAVSDRLEFNALYRI